MNQMKLKFAAVLAFLLVLNVSPSSAQKKYVFDTIPNDPLHARIYELENGLKVYLSVYKNAPRFQSMIGIKAGSKNDPSTHTGLAHYLEHMLFKGTDKYGTLDYKKEAPLIDTIFSLYEVYGSTTDVEKRKAIYHKIDSVSGVAAKYAIPNEFDKMMAGLGVSGVNAYTSNDQTVYINDVPSNQLKNFFEVEAERFRAPVMRLFHTELEAVYEEKNRGLDSDGRKAYEALFAGLFPTHPYGTQTTIGTIEHLKSPSLVEIKKFLETYYVPNNMVIALSGDFNPDEAIKIIDQNFGKMKSKPLPKFNSPQEKLIKTPVVKEVIGPDAESVLMGFRFGGAASQDADVLTIVDMILSNGQAGLFDINLNNSQKVLNAGSSVNTMKDYSMHILSGRPREGQTLEEVRDLMLKQIVEIKNGNFPDWMIPAIVTNMKLDQAKQFEDNYNRASEMLDVEINGTSYKDFVTRLDRLSKINKAQVVQFVRDWYGDNYVIVYKRTGIDSSVLKVVKPEISPIETNANAQSDFLKNVLNKKAPAIQPVFIDYNTAITSSKLKSGIPVYSVLNKENDLFNLSYTVEMGTSNNPMFSVATDYIKYLATSKYTSAQIKEEFYKLGCDFYASASEDNITISLTGVKDRFMEALILLESILADPKEDDIALKNLVDDILKRRENAKLNKNVILSNMQNFAKYGAKNSATSVLSEEGLKALIAKELVVTIRNLTGYMHRIDYYGPESSEKLIGYLEKFHKTPRGFQAVPPRISYPELSNDTGKVFLVDYDMTQAEIVFISKGVPFNRSIIPTVSLYNRYFAGDMASPVFQTLRESKALAYSVSSRYSSPGYANKSYFNTAYIGTQSDKLPEAMAGMMELLTDMPTSEKGFENAKQGAIQQIQTTRITKDAILSSFHSNRRLGINDDYRKGVYETIQTLKLNDIVAFQKENIKNLKYTIVVLGKKEKLDMNVLSKYGNVQTLELKDIFGY